MLCVPVKYLFDFTFSIMKNNEPSIDYMLCCYVVASVDRFILFCSNSFREKIRTNFDKLESEGLVKLDVRCENIRRRFV